MQNVETLIHARWIVPVEPHDTVLEHHSLAIRDGRIGAILPTPDARRQFQSDEVFELDQHVLIPGLINAHTHAAMSLFRGLADDLPLMAWLQNHIWPAEAKWVSPEFVQDGVRLAMTEMLRGGITCFNDMYFYPDEAARVIDQAGMRAAIGLILLDFPTMWAKDSDEYLRKGLDVHDRYRSHPLLTTVFAPHAPYTVSDAPLQRVAMYAEELDISIQMHIHETAFEVAQAQREQGRRPLQRLQELGLLTPRLQAVHMTQLTDAEITQLGRLGTHVIHCPESNLKLASGFCPVQKLLDAGVNVALGTDGAASNNDLDLLGEMRTAALLGKAVANDASALPAATALRMATLNGARAMNIDQITGSLEIGKAADITALRLDNIESAPLYNVISHLAYATGRDQVSDVWVAGRQLLKQRRLTTLDGEELVRKAETWSVKIRAADTAAKPGTPDTA